MVQNPEAHISENMKNISDVYEVQILLAYFLGQINQLCTPNQLTEIATGEGVVNYFVYTEAVSRMVGKRHAGACGNRRHELLSAH